MRVIVRDLPSEIDRLTIVPFSDWHKDDPRCNQKYVEYTVERIKADNTYCIANGDLVNMALKNSVSDIYENCLSPQDQLDWVIETLRPIKDKILCYDDGNHERRIWREVGISPARYITSALGIAGRRSDGGSYVFLSFGKSSRRASQGRKMTYTIYAKHGSAGGKKEGGKVNALMDYASVADADVYVMGHVHMPFQTVKPRFRPNLTNRSIAPVNSLYVCTGAALEYGGYAEIGGYSPAALASMEIVLDGHKRGMKAAIWAE